MNYVILVEPEGPANIGAVARLMRNFDFDNLVIINPKCKINMETRKYAMRAWDVVEKALILSNFQDIKDLGIDFLVGTTAKVTNDSNTTRVAITPKQLSDRLSHTHADIGLVFGRESSGLTNDELRDCDIVVNIPTGSYKALNLSHAVGIILYELYQSEMSDEETDGKRFRTLMNEFEKLINQDSLNVKNKENTSKIFRSMVARSIPTKQELGVTTMIFKKINEIFAHERLKF